MSCAVVLKVLIKIGKHEGITEWNSA